MADSHFIFDRRRVRRHRDRAAAHAGEHDFLLQAMAERIADRLADFGRVFPLALDLGAHHGVLAEHLQGKGVKTLVQSDVSARMIGRTKDYACVADEEFLPFAANSFDLVVSAGSLHWVNDLPGALIQIRQVLKPGGLLLAMLPGGETLKELRRSFEQAELAASGGISPRISPFVDVRSAAGLVAPTPGLPSRWRTAKH